jgi:hypothetical protein
VVWVPAARLAIVTKIFVGIAQLLMWLATDQTTRIRFPVGARIFSSLQRRDRFWNPPSHLYKGSLAGGKAVGSWNWRLYPVARLTWGDLFPLSVFTFMAWCCGIGTSLHSPYFQAIFRDATLK